jgi:hypothetical protein
MGRILQKIKDWFSVPTYRLATRTITIKAKSNIEAINIPITVNGKHKEIVLQREHAFDAVTKFRPLVCRKAPNDPFWSWYRTIYR